MLPDRKIDLWYVPGWIKQTEQQQSQTIKRPHPSNKSPSDVQKTTAWTRHTIFYLLKTEKKAKAISHHCSNSTHSAEEWPCEARAGVLSRCDKHGSWAHRRACANGQPQHTGEGNSFQAGWWQWPTSCLQRGTPAWDLSQGQLLRDCSYTWSSHVIYSVANKLAKTNVFSHRLIFAP